MNHTRTVEIAYRLLSEDPRAHAMITGSKKYSGIQGTVMFYRFNQGTIVVADIHGLPSKKGKCQSKIFGFHIHEGEMCTGDRKDPFKNAGVHYNPDNCQHPEHAGDLPPLFENKGTAWMAFYTDRFTPEEVVGKTVIIHEDPDDFRSQPSGDTDSKIACGVIQ